MTTAMLAIRLAAAGTRRAIRRDSSSILPRLFVAAGAEVFAHDVANERAGAHGADFEQTHLLTGETHLRDGVVDHHAELGMKKKLKRIAAHNALRGKKNGAGGRSETRAQLCCNASVMAMRTTPYFDEISRFSALQRPASVTRAQQETGVNARIASEILGY
ncbi:MAG TPA: hypothetical protein VJS12_13855 [Steroidobacteraceae bacterium]|nr:hypothetical protein [Steroidobacteraceae bacterium]